jgi:hypothetical protein
MTLILAAKVTKKDHSYRNASIGLRLAAFRAGYHPKKMPITVAKKNDSIMD